jgi:transcription elongation factor SPT6
MAATSGTESTPSYFVMLDPDGNVLDHLELHFLLDFGKKSEGDFDGRKKDSKKLQQFVEIHEPTLLVIDASVRAKKFKETLEDSLRGSQIEIQYLDPSVSRIYSMSLRSKTEFFEYSDLHRFTVSLGRFILDPLPEICALATKNNDLLSLDLHESQKFVNADMLIKYLKRAIINYVSRVGVDLNYINVQRHKSAVLEFVPGLGPHKARHILSRISKKGFLSSRLELLAEGLVGPNVFRNCVGFIRIRPPSQYVSIEFPLIDDTRIHPDDYELADSFIINALDLHTSIHSDEERNKYIEKIRSPSGMKELDKLDLDLYAIELEKRDGKKKAMILKMIASELKYPFKDLARKSFSRYTPEKLFGLLTGEIVGRTIKKGQLVLVTITRISPDGIRCKLDGNVFGKPLQCLLLMKKVSFQHQKSVILMILVLITLFKISYPLRWVLRMVRLSKPASRTFILKSSKWNSHVVEAPLKALLVLWKVKRELTGISTYILSLSRIGIRKFLHRHWVILLRMLLWELRRQSNDLFRDRSITHHSATLLLKKRNKFFVNPRIL